VPIAPSANAQLLTATHYIFVHSLWWRLCSPIWISVGLAPPRKRNAPHRFAPQRNALQCDAAQGNVRPFGAILAAFVCFCPNYSGGAWVTTPHRTMFLDSVYLRFGV